MAGNDVIKLSYMQKRAQMRSRFTTENYKHRWFVLTKEKLTYHDGGCDDPKPGKAKGNPILMSSIKAVEKVEAEAVGNKPNAFQIVYKDEKLGETFILYIVAVTEEDQTEWIKVLKKTAQDKNASFNDKHHCGSWDTKKGHYTCCSSINKRDEGCVNCTNGTPQSNNPTFVSSAHNGQVLPVRGEDNSNKSSPQGYSQSRKLPPPPVAAKPGNQDKVLALYNYTKAEEGDLELVKGETYDLLDRDHEWWWKVQNRFKETGYIPANYVQVVTDDGLEKYDWFYPSATRQSSEDILKRDGNEGCFLVRESSTKGMYTLSILAAEPPLNDLVVRHYHMKKNENGEFFLNDKHSFASIPDTIHYHKHNCAGLVVRLRGPPADRSSNAPVLPGFGYDKFEIDPKEIHLMEELGSGQFGVVKHGMHKKTTHVAVKMMNERTMKEADFIDEAKTMMKLKHEHLVQLYGVCTKHKPIYIVTEYMKNGALNSYLRRHKSRIVADQGRMRTMCIQVANAMQYLEAQKFIHRDLAARNCLVGETQVVKVGDFGLARFVLDDEYTSSQGTKFPIKWAAPEVLQYTIFSSKSDVWAFGILMWEIFTGGDLPYGRVRNADVVEMVCTYHRRLEQPSKCPNPMYDIMLQTWDRDADQRPTFSMLYESLMDIGEKDYVD